MLPIITFISVYEVGSLDLSVTAVDEAKSRTTICSIRVAFLRVLLQGASKFTKQRSGRIRRLAFFGVQLRESQKVNLSGSG